MFFDCDEIYKRFTPIVTSDYAVVANIFSTYRVCRVRMHGIIRPTNIVVNSKEIENDPCSYLNASKLQKLISFMLILNSYSNTAKITSV